MINSVLGSIPIYFMASFLLPQWVIDILDRIRRGFLWGKADSSRGISLMNWESVCVPKQFGGMVVANLKIRNWSLLLRWWWRLYRQPDSLWSDTAIPLRCNHAGLRVPRIWSQQGPFFWKQLVKIRPLFLWSTRWHIGTGEAISYWFDSWTFPIMASSQQQRLSNRNISLKGALALSLSTQAVQLSGREDQIYWLWSSTSCYSAKSLYDTLLAGGKTICPFGHTWNLKVPPTVKVFLYLLIKGKILTHDVMQQRGFNCEMSCTACRNCTLETSIHLFFECSFATSVWHQIANVLGHRIMWHDQSVQLTFTR